MSRPTTKTTSQALLCILYLLLVAKIGQHKKWQIIIAKNNWILRGKADSTETNSNLRIQVTVICILNRFNFSETNEETEYPIQKLLSSRGDVKPPKPLANQTLVLVMKWLQINFCTIQGSKSEHHSSPDSYVKSDLLLNSTPNWQSNIENPRPKWYKQWNSESHTKQQQHNNNTQHIQWPQHKKDQSLKCPHKILGIVCCKSIKLP